MRTIPFGQSFTVVLHHSPCSEGMTHGPTGGHVSTYLLDDNFIQSGADIASNL